MSAKKDPSKPTGTVNGYVMFPEPDSNGATFVRPEHAEAYSHQVRREQARSKLVIVFFSSIFVLMVIALLATPVITYLLIHPTK